MRPVIKATLAAGVLAGVLDIVAAVLLNLNVGPVVVLQSVASGVLGADAWRGGAGAAALGLALHFVLMLVIALVFVLAAARNARLRRQWPMAGVVYGLGVWAVMTLVVVPLSASPLNIPDVAGAVPQIVVHMLCVGLPIAWITRLVMGKGV